VSRTYAARVAILDAGPEVGLGMTATVFTPDIEGERAIRLPLAAIHDPDGKPQVWVVDPATSRVSARAVKLGAAERDAVLIADGLRANEIVVTAGANRLTRARR
jgi:multidrug efflux pump subunit AcrA (membrane-fusion protein)